MKTFATLLFTTALTGTALAQALEVTPGGNVGIGTKTPLSGVGLDVASNGSRIAANGLYFKGSGINPADDLPWARLIEFYGMRFNSPSPTWVLSTSGSFLAGYQPDGRDWGFGNAYISGNVGIGTTTPSSKLDVNGEIVSTLGGWAGNLRMVAGPSGYGAMIRNDGSDTYILLTNLNDPKGGWNEKRPFRINNATGQVYINNILANPPYVTRITITGYVDDDLAISVGGTVFVQTSTYSANVNYTLTFDTNTCLWNVITDNRNNGAGGDGLRAGVGFIYAGSERLTFTPINYYQRYSSNLTYTITYSDGTVISKNLDGWYEAQLCNKILYYAENENAPGPNFNNKVIAPIP